MTKGTIQDTVRFCLNGLEKISGELKRIENIHGEPVPDHVLDRAFGTGVAYNLGRAQSIAEWNRAQLDFLISELSRCLPEKFTAPTVSPTTAEQKGAKQ